MSQLALSNLTIASPHDVDPRKSCTMPNKMSNGEDKSKHGQSKIENRPWYNYRMDHNAIDG